MHPDTVLEESAWGYVVRSRRQRTYLAEIQYCGSVWYVDEWWPGETITIVRHEPAPVCGYCGAAGGRHEPECG